MTANGLEAGWNQLYRIAGIAAAILAAMIPIQALIFLSFPPPSSVPDYFVLFQNHTLLGLLDLDILLSFDNILVVVIYLALYIALKQVNKSLMTIALALGLIGVVLYLVSREATFSMLSLSSRYASAVSEAQKAPLLAAGQTMLTMYNGSAFDVSYVLGAVTTLVVSFVALGSTVIGKAIARVGIVAGVLMLIPPTVGPLGLYLSMISLVPTLAWLILLSVRFIRLGQSEK
jgi:hypothetical protein